MCGTDGVTYDNICVMQSQAVTRMDYGDCGSENGRSLDEHCERVRDTSRCLHNSTNCRHLVQPEDGCCPVCGEVFNTTDTPPYLCVVTTAGVLVCMRACVRMCVCVHVCVCV